MKLARPDKLFKCNKSIEYHIPVYENGSDTNTLMDKIKEYGINAIDAIMQLSFIISFAILSRMIDPSKFHNNANSHNGYNSYYETLRNELIRDKALYYSTDFNSGSTFSKSADIVQCAQLCIIESISKYGSNLNNLITIQVPKKHIIIEDNKIEYKKKKKKQIQFIYSQVSKYIRNLKNHKDTSIYQYRVDTDNSDAENTFYKRSLKYYDQYDFSENGEYDKSADLIYSALYGFIMKSGKLTNIEKTIMHYRIQGFGDKAIATKTQKSVDYVKEYRKRVKRKVLLFYKECLPSLYENNMFMDNKPICDIEYHAQRIINALIDADICEYKRNDISLIRPNIKYSEKVLHFENVYSNGDRQEQESHIDKEKLVKAWLDTIPVMWSDYIGFDQLDIDSQFEFMYLYLNDRLFICD